ncbi:hypothetical protein HBI56_076300 [Parastagonospora nodorum]|uniref:Uncharacterized protein n=1 Tax=Phaeosphaeria nodorum (strain SN15 / ATCC MYA-4574 / FGSC 10173) TaxID=321614 RepID=Q0UL11_PHANO|nr:hypothetical protein SNOG_07553 [Parastagonospora nodorum SN15]KAH3910376.1 hypothetical protein HBH56_150860 [Parastagonospora nodorum]EAT85019.1 hypothetical protein SNOG_07553 [Parastagonospora nodorum SN15]KAH3928438.1 hypothetical protein HBH54_136760 [Parastagonospora nodorum]KAH3946154.1 hypothetical protein HBH53_138320 [Parastagonospora nodorum]KAH3983913.1 hypothetical protein HBH52_061630 [Parastagonospora nodorum]
MSTVSSLAPSQASKSSFFNRFQRTPSTSSVVSTATNTSKSSSESTLSAKVTILDARNEELSQVNDLNRLTLQKLAEDLELKELECTDLRRTTSTLEAELEQTVHLNSTSSSSYILDLEAMQEKLELSEGCQKELKCSVRAKEEEISELTIKIAELAGADESAAAAASNLTRSLSDAHQEITDLLNTIKDKDVQLSAVSSDLDTANLFQEKLLEEHCEYSHNACKQQDQVASLQKENDTLAMRAAAAEFKNARYATHIDTFTKQFQSLSTFAAESQVSHDAQVDAMHAQQQDASARFQRQLLDRDNMIASLQQRLTDSEAAQDVAGLKHKDDVARLENQVTRLDVQVSESEYQHAVWQDYANEQVVRLGKL